MKIYKIFFSLSVALAYKALHTKFRFVSMPCQSWWPTKQGHQQIKNIYYCTVLQLTFARQMQYVQTSDLSIVYKSVASPLQPMQPMQPMQPLQPLQPVGLQGLQGLQGLHVMHHLR